MDKTCNSGTWEAEAGNLQSQSHLWLYTEFQGSISCTVTPCLRRKKRKGTEENLKSKERRGGEEGRLRRERKDGERQMAASSKCLSCNHENLSSRTRTHFLKYVSSAWHTLVIPELRRHTLEIQAYTGRFWSLTDPSAYPDQQYTGWGREKLRNSCCRHSLASTYPLTYFPHIPVHINIPTNAQHSHICT